MKNKTPVDRINALVDMVWSRCVQRRAAKDDETAQRWQDDYLTYMREGFAFLPTGSDMEPAIEDAIDAWKEIEAQIFSMIGMDRAGFMDKFESARANLLAGGADWQVFAFENGPLVNGAVFNIDWVGLFAWILPLADAKRLDTYREIGRMVTATLYTEILYKSMEEPLVLENSHIEEKWRMAKEILG